MKKYTVEIIAIVIAVAVGVFFYLDDKNKPEEPVPTLESQLQQAQ